MNRQMTPAEKDMLEVLKKVELYWRYTYEKWNTCKQCTDSGKEMATGPDLDKMCDEVGELVFRTIDKYDR